MFALGGAGRRKEFKVKHEPRARRGLTSGDLWGRPRVQIPLTQNRLRGSIRAPPGVASPGSEPRNAGSGKNSSSTIPLQKSEPALL